MKALGDYMHAKNVQFALYTAESTETCAGYPASLGYETLDATTMANWGVDYLKGACPPSAWESARGSAGALSGPPSPALLLCLLPVQPLDLCCPPLS